jgi:TonB family protein
MFTNLIESQSHRREFKRKGSFFLITVAAYAVILFGAGIASIYAYDAQLEAQTNSFELLSWVPAVKPPAPKPIHPDHPVVRHSTPTTAPVDPNVHVQQRTAAYTSTTNPLKVPEAINTQGINIPPVTDPNFVIGSRNVDLPPTNVNSGNCVACGSDRTVRIADKPPEPPVVKPPTTERVTSKVLSSKAINLPQPPYPIIAKQAHVQGPVSIQILVSEEGKVLSAQVVSGNPMLSSAAKDAALRARFTPTSLNGQAVKIQGVITYNFVLQ